MSSQTKNVSAVMTFSIGEEKFAFPIEAVRLLELALPITPISGSSDQVLGLSNLRGQIITIVDLGHIYYGSSDSELGKNLIVLKPTSVILQEEMFDLSEKITANDELMALHVTKIEKIIDVSESMWSSIPSHIEKKQASYLMGVVRSNGILYSVFNPTSIINFCNNI